MVLFSVYLIRRVFVMYIIKLYGPLELLGTCIIHVCENSVRRKGNCAFRYSSWSVSLKPSLLLSDLNLFCIFKGSQLRNILTLVMLNKLRCHIHFWFSVNQITWSWLWTQIHILNDKQCRSRSVGFYTVFKGRVYPGSAALGLKKNSEHA